MSAARLHPDDVELIADAVARKLRRLPRGERPEVADTPVSAEGLRKADRILSRPRRVRRST